MTKSKEQLLANFKKKYPNADMSKFVVNNSFDFWNTHADNGKNRVQYYDGRNYLDINWWFLITHEYAKYLDLKKWRKGDKMMEDFEKKYPNADMSKFRLIVFYDQPKKEPVIQFYISSKRYYYNVDSKEFKNNKEFTKYLSSVTLTKSNLMNDIKKKEEDLIREFKKRFPKADMTKFRPIVRFDSDGVKGKSSMIKYFDGRDYHDLNSAEFKNNKERVKYLGPERKPWPEIWGVGGSVPKFSHLRTHQPYPGETHPSELFQSVPNMHFYVNNFRIYVNESEYFNSNFPKIPPTEWSGKAVLKANNRTLDALPKGIPTSVREAPLNYKEEPYFTQLCAAYAATFFCGISWKHLQDDSNTPKIITSLARYHLYYTMRKFIKFPKLMDGYHFKPMRKYQPTAYQPFNLEKVGDECIRSSGWVNFSTTDYLYMIPHNSNGLTDIGLGLFQASVESYMYCVLGAQANLRWSIIGKHGKAIQAQGNFRRLVEDTIVKNDGVILSSNARTAVKNTNVVLNMAISPGIILVPSNMVILSKPIPGYNNILLNPDDTMSFGHNKHANYQGEKNEESVNSRQPDAQTDHLPTDSNVNTSSTTTKEETKTIERIEEVDVDEDEENSALEKIMKLEEEIPDIVKHRKEINAILKDREKKKGASLSSLEKIEIRQNYWKKELKNHLNKASGGYSHPYGDNIITMALIGGLSTAAVYHMSNL